MPLYLSIHLNICICMFPHTSVFVCLYTPLWDFVHTPECMFVFSPQLRCPLLVVFFKFIIIWFIYFSLVLLACSFLSLLRCMLSKGSYVKDLSLLGRDLKNVVIVDNSNKAYKWHTENAIPIKSWY